MILAILAHFSVLWQFGFSKMVTVGTLYDQGPPKRYHWQPNTWTHIKWRQLGGKIVKIGVQKAKTASKHGFSEPKNAAFFQKRAILIPHNQLKPSMIIFYQYLVLWNKKNVTFTHKIIILAILAHFSLLWQIGFSKMVTMGLFHDPGPPKR